MISRVAESCFWMFRYIERLEHTTRLVGQHHDLTLNIHSSKLQSWMPLVIVIGEEERFREMYSEAGGNDCEVAQDFVVWNTQNPTSAYNCLKWSRQNARTIREILSVEMWEDINTFWLWFSGKSGYRLYKSDRYGFYKKVRQSCQLLHGISAVSLSRDTAYDFMCLGMMLERASQISRIMDVNFELFYSDDFTIADSVTSDAHWLTLLRSCFAKHSYFRKYHGILNGKNVLRFLLLDLDLPVSVLHSLKTAKNFLQKICRNANGKLGEKSIEVLNSLIEHIQTLNEKKISRLDWHNELTYIVNTNFQVSNLIHQEFFAFDMSQIEKHLSEGTQ